MCDREQEMQYALMNIAENRMVLIDAFEYELMENLRKSNDIQKASLKIDKDKFNYNEEAPLKVVSGVIKINPDFQDNIKEHIIKNYQKALFTTYLEDRFFHDFGLVDIEILDSTDKKEGVSFYALICSEFNLNPESGRAITAFVSYGNLSTFESMLNRDFILSINEQKHFNEILSEENWKVLL
ncbi:hypothetical protein [Peribacillus sp. R9-11]|uniref:hypothetical protein n=1 Tax=Peribacillus sp. R9-11 TaxID=3073271 RepID=UPI0028683D0F|nr:hypothetical protein [Peribacillus sp. R9-11]WMX58516.1 hypothetical protein RE409_28800 [Peribacillus sp. R9-11]